MVRIRPAHAIDCVKLCLSHKSPEECVKAFVAALVAQGWRLEDAKDVELDAFKVLEVISRGERLDSAA